MEDAEKKASSLRLIKLQVEEDARKAEEKTKQTADKAKSYRLARMQVFDNARSDKIMREKEEMKLNTIAAEQKSKEQQRIAKLKEGEETRIKAVEEAKVAYEKLIAMGKSEADRLAKFKAEKEERMIEENKHLLVYY